MSYNIKKTGISSTAIMPVRDATGKLAFNDAGEPLSITLYGPASVQYQQAKHELSERKSKEVVERMTGKGDNKKTWEEKVSSDAEFLAQCTASFNNFGYDDLTGHAMFVAAYSDISLGHIVESVDKFIEDRAKFSAALKKS